MNQSHQPFDPDTDEQAALWAARLDGSVLTAAEKAELDRWLAADASRAILLSEYRGLSGDLARLLPVLVAEGGVERPREAREPVRSLLSGRWIAAGTLAAVVVAAAVWTQVYSGRPETIATRSAQRRSFTLTDGTVVELNANTSIVVESGGSERRVRLADGEAFFVVKKDKSRPFVVETPAGAVRDIGTEFNVRAESESQLEVTVAEGSVQVSNGGTREGPRVLVAGDQLTSIDGSVSVSALDPRNLDDALAWRKGMIVCDGMPLSEAVARFAHYNGLRITVTPDAAAHKIGGIYRIDDPSSFYNDLETVYKVRVTHESDGSDELSSAPEQ
jgi:transmembrane sensor